jgi:hypothetical protein
MKAYWGSGGIAPRILDLGTGWRCVVNFTPRPLYPQGRSPRYPLDRRLGEPHCLNSVLVSTFMSSPQLVERTLVSSLLLSGIDV